MEAWVGIEPANKGFADPCLTTWLPGQSKKLRGGFSRDFFDRYYIRKPRLLSTERQNF